jgi:hypothetical protein
VGVAGAKVTTCSQSSVVDVVRVGSAVSIGVHARRIPGPWEELHRSHCPVKGRVLIHRTPVGVDDPGDAGASVEGNSDDQRPSHTIRIQVRAPVTTVVGLD